VSANRKKIRKEAVKGKNGKIYAVQDKEFQNDV
jgi:hypothetical protein